MSEAAIKSLGIEKKFPGHSLALVISHSCDIVNDDLAREPEIEVVAIRLVDALDPNCANAKNPRLLHLSAFRSGTPVFVEAAATNKLKLSKLALSTFTPDNSFQIELSQLRVLQDWLASRYKRAAFPDSLAALLSRVEKTIEKIGKENPAAILDVFMLYEPDEPTLQAGERYELWINIVYSTEIPNAKSAAEASATRLRQRFEGQFKKNGVWAEIELVECVAVSEAEFTYQEMTRMKRYKLEYISLKESMPVDPSDE